MVPQEILQHLVEQVDASDSSKVLQRNETTVDEVIFESDIDGRHYYIVRCRPKSNCSISLSPREIAIAKLVAQGLPNKSIGNQLDISQWTVATYLRRIFSKLGVRSRTAMIVRLLEEDLLQE